MRNTDISMQIRGLFLISSILLKKKHSRPIDKITLTQSQFISFIKAVFTVRYGIALSHIQIINSAIIGNTVVITNKDSYQSL